MNYSGILLLVCYQFFFYLLYFRKNYRWINMNEDTNGQVLKQRGSFFIHNMVYVLFNNTDIILLSFFCGLKVTSVYSIYNIVFISVLSLINSVFNGLKFTLGHIYSQSLSKYIMLHDTYQSIYCAFVFSMFSVCYILITPFIKLYTAGIHDVTYVDTYLPLLFCLVNLLSACRSTENNLISLAFHARSTVSRTILEAIINLFASVMLIQVYGIYGCLIGTIISLLYRTNDMIIYANTRILNRRPLQAYKTIGMNFVLFASVVLINHLYKIEISSYVQFFLCAFILTIFMLIIYVIFNTLANFTCSKYVYKLIKGRYIVSVG